MRLTIALPVLFAFVSAAFVEEVCIPIVGSGCASTVLTVHYSGSQIPALPDGSESSLPPHLLQAGAAPKQREISLRLTRLQAGKGRAPHVKYRRLHF
ncbi:hypothetical protein IW261DRAFT_1485494 [Armillaria novae-zelandiae]|uniref:Uncharacterized protein n=1 Tax=Armillaria novae-zelandiae TaxID=153914 RepID=A0AA39P4W3_9AGAR|nr:hypothetical protein IW261DRAFT_1485494 [Armillaria novae-zelandiae]